MQPFDCNLHLNDRLSNGLVLMLLSWRLRSRCAAPTLLSIPGRVGAWERGEPWGAVESVRSVARSACRATAFHERATVSKKTRMHCCVVLFHMSGRPCTENQSPISDIGKIYQTEKSFKSHLKKKHEELDHHKLSVTWRAVHELQNEIEISSNWIPKSMKKPGSSAQQPRNRRLHSLLSATLRNEDLLTTIPEDTEIEGQDETNQPELLSTNREAPSIGSRRVLGEVSDSRLNAPSSQGQPILQSNKDCTGKGEKNPENPQPQPSASENENPTRLLDISTLRRSQDSEEHDDVSDRSMVPTSLPCTSSPCPGLEEHTERERQASFISTSSPSHDLRNCAPSRSSDFEAVFSSDLNPDAFLNIRRLSSQSETPLADSSINPLPPEQHPVFPKLNFRENLKQLFRRCIPMEDPSTPQKTSTNGAKVRAKLKPPRSSRAPQVSGSLRVHRVDGGANSQSQKTYQQTEDDIEHHMHNNSDAENEPPENPSKRRRIEDAN
ncbi:hypothetical protein BJ508DRAFT_377674 [Ascobolus immersus RN42]|uniref:Uncharacterized protein n=1 Tax=Ascobolus immersus RN42 TaxID=1160509 RepID=A0A3N4I0I2_ASCIM|nr:hypothetical protein BJ508DRAFT_377674 [Ascobolus immersus RN42]